MNGSSREGCVLVLLVSLAWMGLGCATERDGTGLKERTSGESIVVEVNSKAPAFAARTLDGNTVRLADYVGRDVVLLEFWSIFCKSCLEEMPRIEDLQEEYGEQGLAVLSVNTDVFSGKRVASFLEKAGIRPPYPILRDQRQEVAGAFGVELLPVTVIIDREGWIRLYQEGYAPGDERVFERTVSRLLGKRGREDVTLAARGGVTAFAPTGTDLAAVGDQAPQLTAQTLAGSRVQIGREQPHLLYFWSLYCNPCRAEFPALAALAKRHQGRGLEVTTVNVDSPRLSGRVARFVAGHEGLRCVLDTAEGEATGWSQALGVRVTPTLVLLGSDGTVAFSASGQVDPERLEAEVLRLLDSRSL